MLLAADAGPGGFGALILVLFIVVAIVIFVAMSRSLKRMRSNADRGVFGESQTQDAAAPEVTEPTERSTGRSED
jgi:uncharacterized membrane protein